MADSTHIEWTDATWNVVTGCSVVSPGCTNCYAMRLAGGRMQHHPSRAGLTIETKAGPVWNGQVRFNEAWLYQPRSWKTPRRIFVAAHGDLFHEGVSDGQLMRIMSVIAETPHHTYQILTKRPERARDFLRQFADVAEGSGFVGARGPEATRAAHKDGRGQLFADMLEAMGTPPEGCAYPTYDWMNGMQSLPDFLPNIWLGVSVEDQVRADERIPILLDTPAAVRWISAEPLLGPVDISKWLFGRSEPCAQCPKDLDCECGWAGRQILEGEAALHWVVVGGESGPGARPMHPDWSRQIRDQCAAAEVPFLFKQWGAWEPRAAWSPGPVTQRAIMLDGSPCPDDVAPQDVGAHRFVSVGKKAAGRLLDGVQHDGYPQ
ncbi:DUF5131 family protein [Brevundimonas subvibrioides]|uniref:Gp37Gp68 family protein n=1 Tax=Brevundimonas subvibrioides (strain ATCC 15264 / DSM 4735 / LMG 14903 / NBRC 16000 / CB 81) TaxID=633149 RepID=D9QFV3_BRESC|nr:phage Gp37/Gp68 family protein [Brevundimonas subvibrioides]ADL00667.1 Gp37Gp68 family protein [Brevundimonas subvibrioides ATCC 15264]